MIDETLTKQKEIIKGLAFLNPYEEICGVILNDGTVFPCKNISNKKGVHFLIDPKQLEPIKDNIYCTYHTHPFSTSVPSREDELIAKKIKKSGLIFSLLDKSFCFYSPSNKPIPLLGRPFILGTLDCIELVKDYYAQNLNIVLKNEKFFDLRLLSYTDMPNSPYNKEKFKNVMKDYFISLDFYEVNDLKVNDVLLFKEKGIIPACHAMVYIGKGEFLGQSSFSVSKVQSLKHLVDSGKIKQKAYSILRLKK